VAAVKLIFRRLPVPTPGPVRLVFGDDDAQPAIPDVTLHGSGRITGLRLHIGLRAGVRLVGGGRITGMRLCISAKYDINVSRPTVGGASTRWQDAAALSHAARSTWQQSALLPAGTRNHWQDAAALAASLQVRWEDSQQLQRAVRDAFEQAAQLATAPTRSGFQEAERVRTSTAAGFQQAIRLPVAPLRVRFEETLRDRQARTGARFEVADILVAAVASGMGLAVQLPRSWGGRFQQAWTPRPGQWQRPVPPKPGEPCYQPALPAHLVFSDPFDASLPARLVFVCERHGPDPEPNPPQYVIPLLRVYMTVHNISAVLIPSLERVQLRGISIASNDDGYGWSLTASGPLHLFDQLAPVDGLPARIRVTMDGIDWVFAVDPPERSRKFGDRSVSVRGSSITSLLGAPHLPARIWDNLNATFTAQQLVAQALEFTGVTIDWGLTDWLVPAGAWNFSGVPLAVAMRIAEAAGAVVRSHRTDAQLQFAPRYPLMPWEWASATPSVRMPGQIITTDNLQHVSNPPWDAAYVVGEAQGVKGHIVRAGTAGAVLAPQVTDALITHPDAARQRGRSVLGPSGKRLTHSMTVPLLTGGTNPGLILPGYLIEVVEPSETWRGLVRGITVSESMPTVRQAITVERNP
jgi:hypothetical protein